MTRALVPLGKDSLNPASFRIISTRRDIMTRTIPQRIVTLTSPDGCNSHFTASMGNRILAGRFVTILRRAINSTRDTVGLFHARRPHSTSRIDCRTLVNHSNAICCVIPPRGHTFKTNGSIFGNPGNPRAIHAGPGFPPSIGGFTCRISLRAPDSNVGGHHDRDNCARTRCASLT